MILTWLKDKLDDFKSWLRYDKPIQKFWKGTRDRVEAVIFCLMLLIVGIYSPRLLRQTIIDSLKHTK